MRIEQLENKADARGDSYYLPRSAVDFLGAIDEVHVVTIPPGGVRANHFHVGRREIIFVMHEDAWKLAWRSRAETNTEIREWTGSGGVILYVEPEIVHAIQNTGTTELNIMALSDRRFDPAHPDTFKEVILQ